MVTVPRQRGRPPKQESIFDLLTKTIASSQEENKDRLRDELKACATDPVRFVETYIKWKEDEGPASYQKDVLAALVDHRRVAIRSPHGVGKTALAAWIVLWFALTSEALETDWLAIATAGTWNQITVYLWPTIHRWARRLNWERLGRKSFDPKTELLNLSLKLEYGEAVGLTSGNPEHIEGAHASRLLYLFDEAKSIPAAIFDAAEGALSAGGAEVAYALAFSTPSATIGRFREIWTKRSQYADWYLRYITPQEAIAAGRLDPKAMEDRKRQWGEGHPLYRIRMLGEFAEEGTEGVIPLSWIEQAQRRWEQWAQEGKPTTLNEPVILGVDVAREGEDHTAIAVKRGAIMEEVKPYPRGDTMQTTGYVVQLLQRHPGALAVVDVIGLGAGVVDRLREQQFPVEAFQASERAPSSDKSGELTFLNRRAWAWWAMRELLDPTQEGGAQIALPPDEELLEDLAAPRWQPTSAGRIQVEDKPSIKKRLGRSPDKGDATVMACVGGELESLVAFW